MAARTAVAQRTTVSELDLRAEGAAPRTLSRPELAFDFSGRRAAQTKARVEETSTIKEAIVRWLEEQL